MDSKKKHIFLNFIPLDIGYKGNEGYRECDLPSHKTHLHGLSDGILSLPSQTLEKETNKQTKGHKFEIGQTCLV